MSKITKTKTNADVLLELEARRAKARKLIYAADRTVMAKICAHCKNENHCLQKHDGSLLRDEDECVTGTIDWLEQEAEI